MLIALSGKIVVAECRSSRIYARAECNRNFGEESGHGGKIIREPYLQCNISLVAVGGAKLR